MPIKDDDPPYTATNMAEAVRDMARQLERYSRHADDERNKFREEMNATVELMRKDVYRVIIGLQLNASQHRDEHIADRKDRATDAVDRLNRQLILNVWLGALTILVVVNLLLIGFVVVRVAQVMYGR